MASIALIHFMLDFVPFLRACHNCKALSYCQGNQFMPFGADCGTYIMHFEQLIERSHCFNVGKHTTRQSKMCSPFKVTVNEMVFVFKNGQHRVHCTTSGFILPLNSC